jgi:hypothetical protein
MRMSHFVRMYQVILILEEKSVTAMTLALT